MQKLLVIGLLWLCLGVESKIEVTIGGKNEKKNQERELLLNNPMFKNGLSMINKMRDAMMKKLGLVMPTPLMFKTPDGIKKIEDLIRKLKLPIQIPNDILKDPHKAKKKIKRLIRKIKQTIMKKATKLIRVGGSHLKKMLRKFGIKIENFTVPWWDPFKPVNNKLVAHCLLTMEVYPLYYTTLTRSSNFRLAFNSNCLSKRDINFEIYYNMNPYVNFDYHPTRIILKLWGNVYKIDYRKPKIIDRFDVMRSIEYQRANIRNLSRTVENLHTTYLNNVVLDPQSKNTFNTFNIRKIAQTKGRVQCNTVISRPLSFSIKKIMAREKKKYYKKRKRKLKEVANKNAIETERDKFADTNSDVFGKQALKQGLAPRELKQVKKKGKKKKKGKRKRKGKKRRKKSKLKKRSRKQDIKEMKKGRQGMLLLLSKNSIKEILIECVIN